MKKVLILGVNGFIGHHLSKRILETTDWHVYGMDMNTDRITELLDAQSSLTGARQQKVLADLQLRASELQLARSVGAVGDALE